jgi:hypothetical protein
LAQSVYALRGQRQRFRLELMALATLFAIAIGVLLLGFIWPLLSEQDFIAAYSILIGLAFFAVTLTLLRFDHYRRCQRSGTSHLRRIDIKTYRQSRRTC